MSATDRARETNSFVRMKLHKNTHVYDSHTGIYSIPLVWVHRSIYILYIYMHITTYRHIFRYAHLYSYCGDRYMVSHYLSFYPEWFSSEEGYFLLASIVQQSLFGLCKWSTIIL